MTFLNMLVFTNFFCLEAIQQQLTYHLEADLLMISRQYHNVLRKNKQVYLISVMERNTMPEIHLNIHYNATKFLHIIMDYLADMISVIARGLA